jgi:hypothetical protein
MKRNGIVLLIGFLTFLLCGAAHAGMVFTAQSPEDVAGEIPGGNPFTIDIHVDYTGVSVLSGLTFGVHLYSDDGTIATVTHRDVGGPVAGYPNITYSAEWITAYGAILNQVNFNQVYGFNGSLPDSAYFVGLSLVGGLTPGTGDQNHIQFALQVDEAVGGTEGRLCIDSVGVGLTPDWDWKIPAYALPATFSGPYCWLITGLSQAGVNEIDSESDNLPNEFSLGQNYPNPFNPDTKFEFALPHKSYVKISIFNVLGQNIKTLADEEYPAGHYLVDWDGKTDEGTQAASGIYFYMMEADNFKATKKLMLLK